MGNCIGGEWFLWGVVLVGSYPSRIPFSSLFKILKINRGQTDIKQIYMPRQSLLGTVTPSVIRTILRITSGGYSSNH